MTQAVILAGGLGTRLRPLTKTVPKPMVPIDGVPYLEHQLRFLRNQSITDIVLLTGYLGEQITSHFADGAEFGLSIRYSQENTPLGTGGALRAALELLEDRFLVIYGDSYLPIQYEDVLDSLEPPFQGVVTVYDNQREETGVTNNISLDDSGAITKYSKDDPDDPELKYVEAGVLALRKSVISALPDGKLSLENEVFPLLTRARQLLGFVTAQRFYDIGTPERLSQISHLFQ